MVNRTLKVLFLAVSLALTPCAGGASVFGQQRAGDVPAELTGKWYDGSVSLLQYKNSVTGSTTPGRGSSFTYKFFADGRFEFVGLMQTTMYNCTTTLYNEKSGAVEIDGSTITLVPERNFWRNTNSCAPSSNKEKNHTLERETYEWQIKQDEQGRNHVCLTNAAGERCFRQDGEE